ncbi:MAG TPA: PfkB family carbohydrate kinase [Candidatus Limnocylindrales bacterium]|nr:PfkB family carbohydrate kinase [Candidatus Limnocylindrales bacterium]
MTPDFVAIGHVTVDRTPEGSAPGGSAYYAAHTAHRLGLGVGLLTSRGPDFPDGALPPGAVVDVPAPDTTTFEIGRVATGRSLRLRSRASDLGVEHLPPEWRSVPLILVCPVANEVDPLLVRAFPEGAVAVAAQGWLRRLGARGAITPEQWESAFEVLPHVQALVVSAEDVAPFEPEALEWFQHVPVGAITRGRAGATLFVNGEPYHVAPDPAVEVSGIGAGDVFATTLLIEYQRQEDPWEAAAAAACAAAAAVEGPGVAGLPDRETLERRLAAYRRRRGG